MVELADWRQQNARYLQGALTSLRLRLVRQARSRLPVGVALAPNLTSEPDISNEELVVQLERVAAEMAAAEATEPPPAPILLSQQLGLSRFEQEILLLCGAIELDPALAELCAQAQGNLSRPHPNFALALSLFENPNWDVLLAERPLRYWQLLTIHQPAAQPLTSSALQIDERIFSYLQGLNFLDDRLAPFLFPLDIGSEEGELAPSQQAVAEQIGQRLEEDESVHRPPAIQLLGLDPASQQLVARQVTAALGMRLYRLPVELLPAQGSELETLARLWQRESLLLPIALYLDCHETDAPASATALHRFLARSNGLFFLGSREIQPRLGRPAIAFEVGKPTSAEQRAVWRVALDLNGTSAPLFEEGEGQCCPGFQTQIEDMATRLAGQFNLNLTDIRDVARTALRETGGERESLWDGCLSKTRPRLESLAQRLEPKATWEDIVLPEEAMDLLRQMVAQVGERSQVYETWGFQRKMNRGLGISALFAGDSGTGKTMAAEAIANDLRLNLYRIDLSAVVSKYIGETEKNLRRLFDAAEDGGAVLFFDEADALFGKRGEVRDSHDRYANIEVSYLLQRLESYRGLAILATNFKSALDTAFLRRLRFIIEFPFPGATERQRIWQGAFPVETPVAELDWERLAHFNLTGGNIHNIALNAAFRAAKAKTLVTMPLVLAAIRTEFRKIEQPINELDFEGVSLTVPSSPNGGRGE